MPPTVGAELPPLLLALRRLLPSFALAAFALVQVAVLANSGATIGYDSRAYLHAAKRLLAGRPLYDSAVDLVGAFGIYLYPPPFALAVVPFTILSEEAGVWAWTAMLVGAFLAGCALLPVRPTVRWLVLLLGGVSFPLAYAVKLGQVGPLLFLFFVVGWRSLGRPAPLGLAIAAGTLTKLQPALLFGWAFVTRQWRAVAVGLAACAVAGLVTTLATGVATWSDYLALLGRVSNPVTTPRNVTPGAIAYGLGAPVGLAMAIQLGSMAATIGIAAWACLRAPVATAYVVTVVASQLLSPLLEEHYAVLLLVPVAFLLERRQWWAAAIPLLPWLPARAVYPVLFAVCLLAPLWSGSARSSTTPSASYGGSAGKKLA